MMSAERGAAINTIEAYRRDLADYGSYLKSRGTPLERALPEDVNRRGKILAGPATSPG